MDKQWLINKTPRSVEQLRLWAENPRLNPELEHVKLSDFSQDFTNEQSDKSEFIKLVKSIAEDGFIPADPIVVWQNQENQKYYVAEGNRRIVALKLLRNPQKAPQSIRATIRKLSSQINLTDIEKIYVNVAPTFEDAEWYISQRNSASSLQRKWTSEQQRRWISELYEKHNKDVKKIISITKLTKNELESIIRLLKIKDFTRLPEVKCHLTNEEFEESNSYRFPMTVLERFFSLSKTKEMWGLEYNGFDVNIISNKHSFYNAFAELIKQIIAGKITTRFTKEDLPSMLDELPTVSFENIDPTLITESDMGNEDEDDAEVVSNGLPAVLLNKEIRGNPQRKRLIPEICKLNTSNHKLDELFKELQRLPFSRKYSISVVLRVFFDMSVMEYIDSENIETQILNQFSQTTLRHINLKKRLEYIKQNQSLDENTRKIINQLINPHIGHYSLDTLNKYVHGRETYNSSKQFLNGFWDFLYPLFEKLLDIKEVD